VQPIGQLIEAKIAPGIPVNLACGAFRKEYRAALSAVSGMPQRRAEIPVLDTVPARQCSLQSKSVDRTFPQLEERVQNAVKAFIKALWAPS